MTTRPTAQLLKIIAAYPSINAASRAFHLDFMTLDRFLKGKGSLSADSLALIIERTGLSYDDLFQVEQDEPKRKPQPA